MRMVRITMPVRQNLMTDKIGYHTINIIGVFSILFHAEIREECTHFSLLLILRARVYLIVRTLKPTALRGKYVQ